MPLFDKRVGFFRLEIYGIFYYQINVPMILIQEHESEKYDILPCCLKAFEARPTSANAINNNSLHSGPLKVLL